MRKPLPLLGKLIFDLSRYHQRTYIVGPGLLVLTSYGQRVYVNSSRGLGFLSGYSRPLRFHTGFSLLWENVFPDSISLATSPARFRPDRELHLISNFCLFSHQSHDFWFPKSVDQADGGNRTKRKLKYPLKD